MLFDAARFEALLAEPESEPRFVPSSERYDERELAAHRYLNPAPGSNEREGRSGRAEALPAIDAIDAIEAFARELERVDIELVVLPIPSRIAIDDARSRAERRIAVAAGELAFCRALVERGVAVLDLYGPFATQADASDDGAPVYLERDFHWSPAGAARAAALVAAHLRSRPWFAAWCAAPRPGRVDAVRPVTIRPPGADGDARRETVRAERASPADGLSAKDRHSPILILGDSHLTIFDDVAADFGRRALVELGCSLDIISIPDGAPDRARQALARRDDWSAAKRIVVWVFSVRALPEEQRWQPIATVR